jgi:hypothetical protein
MIYDTIETKKITTGTPSYVFGKIKTLTPIYYNNTTLEFTEKNRFVKVNGIELNQYGKKQINIKSRKINEIVMEIINSLESLNDIKIKNPISSDGNIRLNVTKETRIVDNKRRTVNQDTVGSSSFSACISIVVPTFFTDGNKCSIQLNVGECVIIEIKESLEIDFDLLKLSE